MVKNSGITVEKLALIASARNYLINVIAVGVAKGGGATNEEVDSQMGKLEKQERGIIDQIEKIDGNK